MTGSRPSILVSDLYDAAVRTAAEIKLRQAAIGVAPSVSRYDEEKYNAWIKSHAFPHQSLDFGGDVSYTLEGPARDFARDLDAQVDLDVARAARSMVLADTSADLTITAAMRRSRPYELPMGLGKVFGQTAKNESARKGAANDMAAYATEMRHTLRTLKAAMTGTEPDARYGYKTYPVNTLYASEIPTSQQGWSQIRDNAFKALAPEFVDSLVVDNKATDQSWGVSMLRWGDNDYGQAENPSYSLRARYAYSREQVHYASAREAQDAFRRILDAKDTAAVDAALGKPDTEYNSAVTVRHTNEGNFTGGAVGTELHHPNADVRARARAAQGAAARRNVVA